MQSRTQSPTFNISMASVLATSQMSQSFKNRNKMDKSSSPPSTRSTNSNSTAMTTMTTSSATASSHTAIVTPLKAEKDMIPHDVCTM